MRSRTFTILVSQDARIEIDNQPQIDREQLAIAADAAKLDALWKQSMDALERLEAKERAYREVQKQSLDWMKQNQHPLPDALRVVMNRMHDDLEPDRSAWEKARDNWSDAAKTLTPSKRSLIVTAKIYHFVPTPVIVIIFLILPVMAYRRRVIRSARKQAGLCADCGYDLRATLERCPECGTTSKKTRASIRTGLS